MRFITINNRLHHKLFILGILFVVALVTAIFVTGHLRGRSSEEIVVQEEVSRDICDQASYMIDILCPKLDPVLKERIAECVGTTSEELHVPPEVIVAIAWKESRFKPMACSKKNAEGIMQVMLSAHGDKAKKYHITKDTIFHIDKNVFFGTLILKGYFLKTSSMKTALERYLGGRSESYVLDILNTATSLRMQLALLENENKPKTNGKGK